MPLFLNALLGFSPALRRLRPLSIPHRLHISAPSPLPSMPKSAHETFPVSPTHPRIHEIKTHFLTLRRERILLALLARTQPPRLRLLVRQELLSVQQRHTLRMAVHQMTQWTLHMQPLAGTTAQNQLSAPTSPSD